MIGTIRKHSAVLWWSIIPLTIISFVIFMGSGPTRTGGARTTGLGTIYGKPVTSELLAAAQREFYIYYWLHYGEFPDKNFSHTDAEREGYIRLLLTAKAKSLGIHISDEALVTAANELLRSIGRNGQAVPMSQFLEKVLQPEGLDAQDFQRFVRDDLTIQQLVQAMGLPGALVPPQEAGRLYDARNQEVSAQAVFFSATNYFPKIPDAAVLGQFYSNNMAAYRHADRVQVNYLEYDLTNFLATAEQKLGRTNLDNQAAAYYTQHLAEITPEGKTPEEAKAKIREIILRQEAAKAAVEQAREFVRELFAMEPVQAENLVTLAKQKGLDLRTTAPFTATEGPQEFPAPSELTKTAFKLNGDSPFSKPIAGAEAVYVIGLAKQIPSAIQPLDQIRDRVVDDYRLHEGVRLAQNAGTNLYYTVAVQMASGKTFAQAVTAAGRSPQILSPFSLSSQTIPEAEGRAEINELKEAAFTTQPGHLSKFFPTADGGFVLFVQSLMPMNEAKKTADLPQFLSQVRRERENEAFNLWLQNEATRELRDTLVYAEMTSGKTPAK